MFFDIDIQRLILAVIVGTLAAIVYSLRVLVLIEKIMREEIVIEKEVHGLKKKR